MPNRRADIRVKVPEKMNAVITYTDTMTHISGATVANVSRKGVFLKTDTALGRDAYVNLKLDTKKLVGKPLYAQGFVVRTESNGVGIRLTYMEQDIIDLLFG